MSKIDQLIENYTRHIAVPWADLASAQRVIFCVYNETEELRLRAKVEEFELVTKAKEHDWALFDLTNSFAEWMATQKYANSYFKKPQLINTLLPKYITYIGEQFQVFTEKKQCNENTVIAISGVGSLFGFQKIKDLVDMLAPKVQGRLLVFFPGSFENNNYRLLDGYDGWNYLATPITADTNF